MNMEATRGCTLLCKMNYPCFLFPHDLIFSYLRINLCEVVVGSSLGGLGAQIRCWIFLELVLI